MDKELAQIVKALKNYMSMEAECGMLEAPLRGLIAPAAGGNIATKQKNFIAEDRACALSNIEEVVKRCSECELFKTRRNTVFGEGNARASLMLIGEAPGMEEDVQGRPFVGRAGKLLNSIIEAINMKREDVYIANCLKCRPPQNRTPLPSEIVACRNYLTQQIEIIKPRVICCLGRPAAQSLLMTDLPIGKVRGKFYDYNGIKVMPTFHPAYLLRNPNDKRLVWEDFKKIRDELKK
ncbi:MAG: uracil-DNA glycosylase [Candidatus Omnitrophota bacterium]